MRRYASGNPYEDVVGYSRAVEAGGFLLVSGCTSVVDGVVTCPGDAEGQARRAIANIGAVLAQAGLGLGDVVRTRIFVTDIARWDEVARAHREAFGASPPASTMVQVAALIDPAMLVEVEADAFRTPQPSVHFA